MSSPAPVMQEQAMLLIPDRAWNQMLDVFASRPSKIERVGYLDGVRGDTKRVVTTVTIPDAVLGSGHYHVGVDAAHQAGQALRRHGLVRLAQVHTHPGRRVDHSETDDRYAYSQVSGSISIVLPEHGRTRPAPADAGVHVREPHGWRQLSSAEADQLIQ